jgi:hypothetical protein
VAILLVREGVLRQEIADWNDEPTTATKSAVIVNWA